MSAPSQSSISAKDFLGQWEHRIHSTDLHTEATERLLDFYRRSGLLPEGRDQALRHCCPNSGACWEQAPRPKDLANSGIAFPWIGKDYFDSRVVVLGMNFDNFGGLAGHYHVCEDHIQQMQKGKRGKDGRAFARGAMLYLRVVLASLARTVPPADPSSAPNENLADLWEHCAYAQTIKCAPGTPRSNPTAAMIHNCPRFILEDELKILGPKVILLLGRSHLRDAVRPWAVPDDGYGEQGPRLERDRALIGNQPVDLISLNHPSGRAKHVAASVDQLAQSLRARPAGETRQQD